MEDESASRYGQAIGLALQRNRKQLRFAALVTVLIAALLWQTQWLTLRPGLGVLLMGQLCATAMLLYRTAALSKALAETRSRSRSDALAWFASEQTFVQRLALFENSLRFVGFLLLAYGFWQATRSLSLAFAIGVIYPVAAHFGISRSNTQKTLRELQVQKNES
jgi:hypothetical protein